MPIYKGIPYQPYSFLIKKLNDLIIAQDDKGAIRYSDTDAATVIQKAIDALTEGGKIFISSGEYLIKTSIRVDDNKMVCGEGLNTILKVAEDVTNSISIFRVGSNSLIANLKLDGNRRTNFPGEFGEKPSQNAIILGRSGVTAKNVFLTNLHIYDFYTHGIWIPTRGVANYHDNINVVNCMIESCDYGLIAEDTHNVKSVATDYIGCNTFSFAVWADIQGVGLRNFLILGGTFNGYNGILASNLKNQIIVRSPGQNIRILGAEVFNSNDHAVDLYTQTIINGCIIHSNNYSGVRLQAGADYSQILNCKIYNQQYYGIRIIGANDVLILGCYIADNSLTSARAYDGVSILNAVRCAIKGCRITGSSQRYGVDENGTSDYTLLDGCILLGNGTAAHTVDALNSVVGDNIA